MACKLLLFTIKDVVLSFPDQCMLLFILYMSTPELHVVLNLMHIHLHSLVAQFAMNNYFGFWSNGVSVSHLVVLLGDNKVLLRAYC